MDKPLITITYDDGRVNNYDVALPLHNKYKVPASFAIIAGRTISPNYWNRHMQPWQVCQAVGKGIEISSHGYYHTTKFTELDAKKLDFELSQSKKVLSGFTDEEVDSLCIPYSASNEKVIDEAKKYYKIIRVHGKKLNDISSEDPLVYSFGLRNDTDFKDIKMWIDKAITEKKWLVLMLHGVVNQSVATGKYDITAELLEKILLYVSKSENIKYVSFKDVIECRSKLKKNNESIKLVNIDSPGSYVLYESEGAMITYHKNKLLSEKAKKIVISFGGLPSKKTKTGFGTSFILNQGYDHIFVAQAPRSQYQLLSLQKFFDVVSPYTKGKDIYTYGSSLGGYAALYYGGIVNAKIISAAPKNSAHKSMRKKSFNHIEFLHAELDDNPTSKFKPIILFDPHRKEESDYIQNIVLKAYPHAKLIKLPYAGHTVLHTMKESAVLSSFIRSYVEDGILTEINLIEEESYIWNAELGREFLGKGDLKNARERFLKSIGLQVNTEAAKGLISLYFRTNELDKMNEVVSLYKNEFGDLQKIPQSLLKKVGLSD